MTAADRGVSALATLTVETERNLVGGLFHEPAKTERTKISENRGPKHDVSGFKGLP